MTLLEEIRKISLEAASKLEKVDCCTDSEIRTLTQYDLKELLPGLSNFRIRKKIHETIHKKRPIHDVLSQLKSFIPDEFLHDALGSNGALHEYLQMLKTIKVEINHVQEFVEAQIDLLEKYGLNQDTDSSKDAESVPSVSSASSASSTGAANSHQKKQIDYFSSQKAASANNNQMERKLFSPMAPAQGRPQIKAIQDPSPEGNVSYSNNSNYSRFWTTFLRFSTSEPKDTSGSRSDIEASIIKQMVMYKMVVSGKTLDKHLDVIERLKGPIPGRPVWLQLTESQRDEDSKVTIVFCRIVSRVGTDVDAALEGISSDKPVILVAMHHLHTPAPLPPPPTPYGVKLGVNVFFLESQGLLECSQNNYAINEMRTKLLEYSSKKSCINKIG